MTQEEPRYHSRDAITPTIRTTTISGCAGLFIASVQATLTKQNIGALGTFTHHGATVATFAAMGGTYEFFRIAAANLREKRDSYNEAIGGFFAGAIVGARRRTLPAVLGHGVGLSIIMATFDYTGGSIFGYSRDASIDEYDRKENLRKNRRRPIQETIDELGEGRGIYGPGYDERRKEKIRERYGIDISGTKEIDGRERGGVS